MTSKRTLNYITALLCIAIASCTDRRHTYPTVQVAPLAEIAIEANQLPPNVVAGYVKNSIKGNEDEYYAMLKVMRLDSAYIQADKWIASPATKVFAPAVASSGLKTDDIAQMLGAILGKADDLGLDIRQKGYATTIWGKQQSIIFCDSIMLIALNHYLGEDYEGYSSFDTYRRAVKKTELLPYDIAEALVATKYPYEPPESQKLINRLAYEGILIHAKMELVPDADLAEALGYDDRQLQWLEENESKIWNKLVATKTIFDTSETVADRLVMPAPSCQFISPDAPGRTGRYIGYKIIKAYFEANKGSTLFDLLTGNLYKEVNPLVPAMYSPS